jgi:IclR family mhp operon transcriptional activator
MGEAIRSVKRALDLIRLMNTRSVWALADLTLATGLPKTSVFRLLLTLEEEGVVKALPGTQGLYRLCSEVRSLAAGFSSGSLLGEVSTGAIIAGTKRLRWPLSVAVFDDCYMRVLFCGMPYSRLAAKATTLNKRYWMFSTALGMAYFSFAHPIEQQIILERAITVFGDHGMQWPYTQSQLNQRSKSVRDQGYCVRQAGAQDATSAIAVPLEVDGDILGSLVCSTYPKSMTPQRIADLYPELILVRAEILTQWRSHQASPLGTWRSIDRPA